MSGNNPQNRYLIHLQNFDSKLQAGLKENTKNPLEPLGKILHNSDARTPFFQLQGLARVEAKCGKNNEKGEQWLLDYKQIEDALGKYDYWVAMLESNKRWKFPAPIKNYFEQQASFYLGVLEERMIKQGWITRDLEGYHYSEEAMGYFRKQLKKADWYKPEKEAKKLAELFRDEAHEIHEKIEEGEIDLDHIELGIHEFRRKLRWLGIYSSALLGKVQLSNSSSAEQLRHFVTKERQSYKFNQLPSAKEVEHPITFLRGGFYAMSDIIGQIGDIKDPGLSTEEMMILGKLFGLSQTQIKQHLGGDYYPHTKVVKDAKSLIEKLIFAENALMHIADHFDKQS